MISMQGGFSFCGVDIAQLGLEYAPENANTYVFKTGEQKLSEQTFDGHDGGYYYGTTLMPKVFTLRCIFQDRHVNDGILANVTSFFRRGRAGRLVFQKRPWVWYAATVISVNSTQMTNYMNGIVTIQLKAYYPFGRADMLGYNGEMPDTMLCNSAMLEESIVPSPIVIAQGEELEEQKTVLLYNGGTERADVAIEIAGDVGEGVTIANPATGEICKFVAMNKADTTRVGKYVICDGLNGKSVLTDGVNSEMNYMYHDEGFITLEPAFPIRRNIRLSYAAGIAKIRSEEPVFDADCVGQYVYVAGQWRRLVSWINEYEMNMTPAPQKNGNEVTEMVRMNEIVITPTASMSLTRLNFVYSPTFE